MDERYFEDETYENLHLQEETLDGYEFVDCTFIGCTLENCLLRRCTFSGCKFVRCRVTGFKTESSQLSYAEFIECQLLEVNWALLLPAGRFAAPLRKIEKCRLKYNHFTNMNLTKFDFSGSEILDSLFAECNLSQCKFLKAKLERTEFFKSDLRKADFRDATGYQMDVMTSQMKGARFSMPEAMNLLYGLGIVLD